MIRHLKALGTVIACLVIGCAIKPLEVATFPVMQTVKVLVSREASDQVERLADLTRRTYAEQAACVVSYGYLPTVGHGAVIAIMELGPSNPYDSDSLRIWTLDDRPFCADTLPNIHTHVVPNEVWGRPSEWDMEHALHWSRAPFKVIVSVGPRRPSKLTVYGIR